VIALALAATLAQATPAPAAQPAPAAAPAPAEAIPADASAADIFGKKCTFCHGADGKSQTKKGRQLKAPNFTGAKWQKHTTDDEIVEAITDGVPKRKMPSFKEKLTADQIKAMVPFLRAFAAKK
jgi:mono/diheme cytochrome c family protein